jgi:FMN phosphatase YigB (HAD superfamily)
MKPLALALLLLASGARADVREISTMAEIRPELTAATLLVFDIDNTLVEPVGNIGSDQWYYYLVKAIARDDKTLTADAAEAKAGEIWSKTLPTVKAKPVEDLTPALIREQQKLGLKIMALTARGAEDSEATFRQLKDIGVDLTATAVRKDDLAAKQKGLYSRGVFFVGDGPDKGKTLVAFLKKIGLRPAKVVFADDKPHHARNVDAALTAAGIPCVSFRYGAADAKVRAFNEVMGEAGDKTSADLLFHGRSGK